MTMNIKLVQGMKPSQTRGVGGQTTQTSAARVQVSFKVVNERSGANRSTYGQHGASEAGARRAVAQSGRSKRPHTGNRANREDGSLRHCLDRLSPQQYFHSLRRS